MMNKRFIHLGPSPFIIHHSAFIIIGINRSLLHHAIATGVLPTHSIHRGKTTMSYGFWADVIVAIHVAYVGYVVVGQLAILIGLALKWQWVRNPWFRVTHLIAISIVAAEAIIGMQCP